MPNNHTSFRRHQRVMVILNNGEKFVARYHERRSRFYLLKTDAETLKVSIEDVRSMSIYKGP